MDVNIIYNLKTILKEKYNIDSNLYQESSTSFKLFPLQGNICIYVEQGEDNTLDLKLSTTWINKIIENYFEDFSYLSTKNVKTNFTYKPSTKQLLKLINNLNKYQENIDNLKSVFSKETTLKHNLVNTLPTFLKGSNLQNYVFTNKSSFLNSYSTKNLFISLPSLPCPIIINPFNLTYALKFNIFLNQKESNVLYDFITSLFATFKYIGCSLPLE